MNTFYLVFELLYLHYTSVRNLQELIILKLIYVIQLFLRPKHEVFETRYLLFLKLLLNNLRKWNQEEQNEKWSEFTDDWHDRRSETTDFRHDIENCKVA